MAILTRNREKDKRAFETFEAKLKKYHPVSKGWYQEHLTGSLEDCITEIMLQIFITIEFEAEALGWNPEQSINESMEQHDFYVDEAEITAFRMMQVLTSNSERTKDRFDYIVSWCNIFVNVLKFDCEKWLNHKVEMDVSPVCQ